MPESVLWESDVQHQPWVGRNYRSGLDGIRVLIAGYSHWSDETDTADFTRRQVLAWADGHEPKPFGTRLRSFFEIGEPAQFWNSVAFFNTLPRLVGGSQQRFDHGGEEQTSEVPNRVIEIIRELQPQRVFVFSRKAWKIWPNYTGSLKNGTLRIEDVGEFDAGTYSHDGGESIAFGLNHPQFTAVEPTQVAVRTALKVAMSDLSPSQVQ